MGGWGRGAGPTRGTAEHMGLWAGLVSRTKKVLKGEGGRRKALQKKEL